jgi:catechol 2,3-dioxygenase
LARSRDFYTEVLGLLVSGEDRDTLYLRGVEERVHHSLVLKRTDGTPACIRAGLRTEAEEDLDKAKFFFTQRGMRGKRLLIDTFPARGVLVEARSTWMR